MSNEFNIFSWSRQIPFCDDIWLGMQARNIALVDMGILRPMEADALASYMERERTPVDILMPLSALSQMWVFSLYEFLRTWRQRADYLIKFSDGYNSVQDEEGRKKYLESAAVAFQNKRRLLRIGPAMYARHLEQFADKAFIEKVIEYKRNTDWLFRDAEALRVTIAKHEIPKTNGLLAEAPGYGRMSYQDGSIYWFILLKDGSQIKIDRRELGDAFLGIDSEAI